jgi:hypothetical protein
MSAAPGDKLLELLFVVVRDVKPFLTNQRFGRVALEKLARIAIAPWGRDGGIRPDAGQLEWIPWEWRVRLAEK